MGLVRSMCLPNEILGWRYTGTRERLQVDRQNYLKHQQVTQLKRNKKYIADKTKRSLKWIKKLETARGKFH